MSETASKTNGAPQANDNSYGPDRTFVQVADWLTQNAGVFASVFDSMPSLASLRIKQCEFEEGYEIIRSNALYSYTFVDGETRDGDEVSQTTALRRLKLLIGAQGEGIAQHCVLDRRPFFLEIFALTLHRDGSCHCIVRHHAFGLDEIEIHEMLEQSYEWQKVGQRYAGVCIELRLWSPYIPAFLKGPREHLEALREDPALIVAHDEAVHFRDEGFRPLFLMRRPPDRIEFRETHIALTCVGEHQELRLSSEQNR